MAWRIDEQVIRGEIDNRTRGRLTGRIWFSGRTAPVELDLAGNAWRDLAGRRLTFTNPVPKPGDENFSHLAPRQSGAIGDCTASRKVKVPEIPMDQIGAYYAAKKPWPWHWGNSLYLEWFSTANGRVVIESASFELTIDPEATWEMTEAEEEAQRRANGEAITNFMARMTEAIDDAKASGEFVDDTPPEWTDESDEDEKPMTEEEAEKMQASSDLLADRINARVKREGAENFEKILEEELERRRRERGETPLTPEQEAERDARIEEMNRIAEEVAKNPAPELESLLNRKHPLAERAFEISVRLMQEPEERGWIPADANDEHPVADLVGSVASASAKFAGALNGERWPPELDFCTNTLVRLKRARDYLDQALLSADSCAQEKLVDAAWLAETRREIEALAAGCDELIAELRARLKPKGE